MEARKFKILIAEDELSLRSILKKLLLAKGHEVEAVGDGAIARHKLLEQDFDLAIVDIKMPGYGGLQILEEVKRLKPKLPFLVMTAQDTMDNAINAMKRGAYDYLTKPFELSELENLVEKSLNSVSDSRMIEFPRTEIAVPTIVGNSKAIREIYKLIGKISLSDVSVLITGESGTGKELIAQAIHQNSNRAKGPFIAVNCAAIPRDLLESELFGYRKGAFTGAEENRSGFFELAHRGTLFLDEIGDLPFDLQGKLLRILQEKTLQKLGSADPKPIDVRILAATNQNIETMVQKKEFREDLYFRLNVIRIALPPLRERKEDLGPLCEHFLTRASQELRILTKTLSDEALALLKKYDWPGNIRELENTIKRAALLSSHRQLDAEDFAPLLAASALEVPAPTEGLETLIEARLKVFLEKIQGYEMTNLYDTILQMVERPLLRLILRQTQNNQLKAAKILGINRNTLRKKIRELHLSARDEHE